MSDFVIRAATPSDAAVIVTLLRELAIYEKLLDHFALNEEFVRRDMLGAACHTELAFIDGAAAGVADEPV